MPRKKIYKYGDEGFHEFCIREGLPYIEKDTGLYRNTKHFGEAGRFWLKEKVYTKYPNNTKGYNDFWDEEHHKCLNGVRIGEIYITGYHYFFMNYHPMKIPDKVTRKEKLGFASFWKLQYDLFNIVDYCQSEGLNLGLMKPRGCGLSECSASMAARDFAITGRDENGNLELRNVLMLAYDKIALAPSGLYNKFAETIDFLNKHTEFYHNFLTVQVNGESTMIREAGNKFKNGGGERTGGKVTAQVLKKADKARGDRTYITLWEESGANPVLSKASKVALGLSRRAGIVTGIHLFWGTSNADTKGIDAFKSILYNPSATYCVRFRNVWEKEDGTPVDDLSTIPYDPRELIIPEESDEDGVGWFIPVYEADFKFTDEDGNPDREKALEFYVNERLRTTKHVDAEESDAHIHHADYPFTLAEALYKESMNQFNAAKILTQIQDVVQLKKYPKPKRGRLEWVREVGEISTKQVKFVESKKGNVFIAEQPLVNPDGQSYKNLYIGGIDSIDTGVDGSQVEKKGSKFAAIIFKRMYGHTGNMPVAYYLERPSDERIAYDEAAKLLTWYKCQANIEATRTNVITYFREKKWGNLLYPRPRLADANVLEMSKGKYKMKKAKKVGTPGHEKYTIHGLKLIAQYVEDFCQFILFEALLNQLFDFTYEKKTKFDLIAAFAMCLIADEDMAQTESIKTKEKVKPIQIGFYRDRNGNKRYGCRSEEERSVVFNISKATIAYYDKDGTPIYNEN